MPKQIETRDRFKIMAEVESEALGPLLAQLARMGLQNMGYELITDVVTFKGRAKHDVSNVDTARAWVVDHPAFSASQLVEHFAAMGRSAVVARSALQSLHLTGEVSRLEKGHYRRVDKQLAPPAAETSPDQQGRKRTRVDGPRVVRDINNWDFIAGLLKSRKQITMLAIREAFTEDGRNPHSASPIVSSFCKQKLMKALGDGAYEVLKVAKSKPITPADKKEKDRLRAQARRDREKAARLNGAGAAL